MVDMVKTSIFYDVPWLFKAVIAQIGFVCIALCGQRGAILASIVIFLHSLFRARPWTVMAKDRLKVHWNICKIHVESILQKIPGLL